MEIVGEKVVVGVCAVGDFDGTEVGYAVSAEDCESIEGLLGLSVGSEVGRGDIVGGEVGVCDGSTDDVGMTVCRCFMVGR